ncbi:transposase (fragment) [Candidatus Desulfosporosinus infrequens]|uniref:Transposase n=1 Tax=Candidatus Desulfosporosinus infrequens TaxID=2043169 RepID=A0A2U3L2Y9_9FIRM
MDICAVTNEGIRINIEIQLANNKNYHSVFRLFEKDEGFELTEALEIHFIDYKSFS